MKLSVVLITFVVYWKRMYLNSEITVVGNINLWKHSSIVDSKICSNHDPRMGVGGGNEGITIRCM